MILYICDGKDPKCSGNPGCMEEDFCYYTSNPEHARYGRIEGNAKWYRERFVDYGCDDFYKDGLMVEKKRW